MIKNNSEMILQQKNDISCKNNFVNLIESCSVDNGIKVNTTDEKRRYIEAFEQSGVNPTFFIPASGSGSRMYKFLYDWKQNKLMNEEMVCFSNYFNQSALSHDLGLKLKDDRSNIDEIVDVILSDKNSYTLLPKGLFPFHLYGNRIKTPFEEHLSQINSFNSNSPVHFTVQNEYTERIAERVDALKLSNKVSYSVQDKSTNAYCFDVNGELIQGLRRPSGHGALIKNLNNLDADFVLVKNIDNVQYETKSGCTKSAFQESLGLLKTFKDKAKDLITDFNDEKLARFNDEFNVFGKSDLSNLDIETITSLLNRPSRVCGMVKNTGAPGGGPFWIKDVNGSVSKQIVESSQIAPGQKEVMLKATHFNPVFMALSLTNLSEKKLDLHDFVDESKYLIVEKDHQGQKVKYRELPGLWNGGMHHWNTLFIEMNASIFSPVKSILDLSNPLHNPS